MQGCRLDLLQGWILSATTKREDMSKQVTNGLFISIWSCAACAKSVGVSISKSKLEEPSFFSVSLKSELVNSSQWNLNSCLHNSTNPTALHLLTVFFFLKKKKKKENYQLEKFKCAHGG